MNQPDVDTEASLNMSALFVAEKSLFVWFSKTFSTRLRKADVNFYDSVLFAYQSSFFSL